MHIRFRMNRSRLCALAAVAAPWALGCSNPPTALDARSNGRPSLATATSVITEMRGTGTLGDGTRFPGGYVNTQTFSFDAGIGVTGVYGTLDYTDSSFHKADGNAPHFVVGPQYPGSAIASFVQTSNNCVEFAGDGYLINTGEFLAFRIDACDYGSPGTGLDTFYISVPERPYNVGPAALTSGEITLVASSIGSFP